MLLDTFTKFHACRRVQSAGQPAGGSRVLNSLPAGPVRVLDRNELLFLIFTNFTKPNAIHFPLICCFRPAPGECVCHASRAFRHDASGHYFSFRRCLILDVEKSD